jgi:hypothetical protein
VNTLGHVVIVTVVWLAVFLVGLSIMAGVSTNIWLAGVLPFIVASLIAGKLGDK